MNFESVKPCLVQTGQGFSVEYNNRLLYSKYNPSKNILLTLKTISLLPDTLVLAVSPCFGYGINELLEILPEKSFVLAVEKDKNLLEFSLNQDYIKKALQNNSFSYIKTEYWNDISKNINQGYELSPAFMKMHFKRCVKIDFSGGASLFKDDYDKLYNALSSSIALFWKNRITLVKFGKKYSSNLFKNLSIFPKVNDLFTLFNSVEKNIIILGAGESTEETITSLKNNPSMRNEFFIIAVDASLKPLSKAGIKADLVLLEESQSIIKKLFTGNKIKAENGAQSLSSFPFALKENVKKVYFYTTLYSNSAFIKKLDNLKLIPIVLPPLGSVGLSAVEIALKLRKDSDVKIYVSGLDFSFSLGKTHANGTNQVDLRFIQNTRLTSIENYSSCFSFGSEKALSKNNSTIFTNVSLKGYAELFKNFFFDEKNLFDIGKNGLALGIPYIDSKSILENQNENGINYNYSSKNQTERKSLLKLKEYFETEILKLNELKSILSSGQNMSEDERNEKLFEILKERDYLYLHFPDGYELRLKSDFLKRVKAETSYFEKIFNYCLSNL